MGRDPNTDRNIYLHSVGLPVQDNQYPWPAAGLGVIPKIPGGGGGGVPRYSSSITLLVNTTYNMVRDIIKLLSGDFGEVTHD